MTTTILIIEDEKKIADWVQRYFEKAGFRTLAAYNGLKGLQLAQDTTPDLIILDVMLPGINGFEVCRRLRTDSEVPIIMLTARDTRHDRVNGLDLGADDYIVKPFDPDELIARAKAVLRRVKSQTTTPYRIGGFELNELNKSIHLNGEEINFTAQQFTILSIFLHNPNRILTRERLIEKAFADFDGFDRAVDTHIRRIRRLIEKDTRHPQFIRTIYGSGYKFVPEAS